MLTDKELQELFQKNFPIGMEYEEISKKLDTMNFEYTDDLRYSFCNQLLYQLSTGYTKYDLKKQDKTLSTLIKVFCDNANKLPQDYNYFKAVKCFFEHSNEACLKLVEKYLAEINIEIDEYILADSFFDPFKQAFTGFWSQLSDIIAKRPHQAHIPQLCYIIEKYYECDTDDKAIELLLDSLAENPDSTLLKELLAITYYSAKKWNNALAYFEQVEENRTLIFDDALFFMMAWCHNKIKNRDEEERYYKKCIELQSENIDAINNLGYCYYCQKKYDLAQKEFEKCLNIDNQYSYAADNMIRVMIATGRYKDAKAFISEGFNVSLSIKRKVEKLKDSNEITVTHVDKEDTTTDEESVKAPKDLGVKRQQFSSEKLLEDELNARIEAGIEVFGLKLKIYKRHGEYGRQFIIPVGRLDLLCEDDEGNLYIIELKKDSGYDDAYKQTADYLDWFEKSKYGKGKKIYGIICLNSPAKELINKVRADKRIKLFEYQISYREV